MISSIPGANSLEKSLVCVCDTHRMSILYALQAAILAMGVAFFVVALHASGSCYVQPCFKTIGPDIMWKVDGGLSFSVVGDGVLYMLHPLVGIIMLYKKVDTVLAGAFVGSGAVIVVSALSDSVIWGTKSTMITEMTGQVYYEDDTPLAINDGAQAMFTALSTLAGFIFALELISLALVTYAIESIANLGSDLDPTGVGRSPAAPKDTFSYQSTGPVETAQLMHQDDDLDDDTENPFDT